MDISLLLRQVGNSTSRVDADRPALHFADRETLTYGELAARSGTGLPARAIGSIMGANPVPLVIPCHRVVAGDGLGGYSGGEPGQEIATKRWLLELEGALPPTLL